MPRAPARKKKPWSAKKATRRTLSPDEEWARDLRMRILADCHPWQKQAVMDPARRVSMLVGRGGAKTTTMRARELIKLTSLKKQRLSYAATTADHARELNWDKFIETLEAYGLRSNVTNIVSKEPDFYLVDAKMRATCLRTGSVLRMRGVEDKRDAGRFRGFPQAEMDIDEVGEFPPELVDYLANTCVAPRLGEALSLRYLDDLGEDIEITQGGCIVLGSTPPPVLLGEFYEVTRDGSDRHRRYADRDKPEYKDWKGYSSHDWNNEDVYLLPNARKLWPALVANWEEALIEKAEKKWSDKHPTWQREYKGRWSSDNTATVFSYLPQITGEEAAAAGVPDGSDWNQWNPHGEQYLGGLLGLTAALEALPKDESGRPFEWHFVLEMDSGGTRDPFACNVFAIAPRDQLRRMLHVFGFEQMTMHAKPIAELLFGPEAVKRILRGEAAEPYGGLLAVIGWPDASTFDADQNLIDELAKVYGFQCKKANRAADYKFGAIELVNGDLIDGRIWVLKGSPLEKQMSVLQWKPDANDILREDKAQANHSTDTLIYGRLDVQLLFETGVVVAETTKPAYVDPMGLGPGIDTMPERDEFAGLISGHDYDDSDWR